MFTRYYLDRDSDNVLALDTDGRVHAAPLSADDTFSAEEFVPVTEDQLDSEEAWDDFVKICEEKLRATPKP